MYVWVVMGKSGFWEEKRWCVKVMDSKEKAISFINKLKDIIKSKEEIGKNTCKNSLICPSEAATRKNELRR